MAAPRKRAGCAANDLGDGVVVEAAELGRCHPVGPVTEHERRRRQHLAIDTEPVQICQPRGGIEDLLGQPAVALAAAVQGAAPALLEDDTGPAGIGVTGEKGVPAARQDVRVDVDRAHRLR